MLELLSPAGGADSLKAGINNGANAVYLGLKKFSARANSENFDKDEFAYYVSYAKLFGVKLYATVNTLIKNDELTDYLKCVESAYLAGADAFIVQDMFLGNLLKKNFPEITLHLSTQAGVCNVLGAELAKEYGFSRVVLARETPLEDIKAISNIIETEAFVQGALCSSFSGHCYMSSFVGGNSGNRGLCKQPCRKKYDYFNDGKFVTGGYALSLSDLCVDKRIEDYIDAGVSSFKIEGRMRRAEYVAAATAYYREILDGKSSKTALSDLKRTYNRNNYTNGLAFGQDEKFISSSVQGHIGECVGKISKVNGNIAYVDGYFGNDGDSYKILRNGKEVASAAFKKNDKFAVLSCSGNVLKGDSVCVTTDTAVNKRLLSVEKKFPVRITAEFLVGKPAKLYVETTNGKFVYKDDKNLLPSINQGLTETDVVDCFNKTGDYPFSVSVTSKIEKVFIAKSKLNGLRRNIYSEIFNTKINRKFSESKANFYNIIPDRINIENASILLNNLQFNGVKIVFPENYNNLQGNGKDYLYCPPFASGKDIEILTDVAKTFGGIYADGLYAIKLAEKLGKKLIVGTEINVFNNCDVYELSNRKIELKNIVLSKELSANELKEFPLSCKRFALGNIPLMHFVYCPAGKNCKNCKLNGNITLKDENGRIFKVKKYVMSSCRFVVYNAYDLIPKINVDGAKLYDFSCMDVETAKNCIKNENNLAALRTENKFTNGNLMKGVN